MQCFFQKSVTPKRGLEAAAEPEKALKQAKDDFQKWQEEYKLAHKIKPTLKDIESDKRAQHLLAVIKACTHKIRQNK